MNDYLVFQTEAAAITALESIYANMVGALNSPDLLDVSTGDVVLKGELTSDEVVQVAADNRHFPIFGVNAASGMKDTQQGYTTAWALAQETTCGKWVYPKPDNSLMGGVTGYTVEPHDPAWFPVVGGNI